MTSVERRERYRARKAARRCVTCEAGLQDEDGVRCVECSERHAARSAVWYKSPRGRRARGEARRERYAANRDVIAAAVRERYLANKIAGRCVRCSAPALDDSVRCGPCRDLSRARARETQRRARARRLGRAVTDRPVIDLAAFRKRRSPSPRQRPVPVPDVPLIEPSMRDRLLLVLRWQDWIATVELGDLLALDAKERNNASVSLRRLVRDGAAETRTVGGVREYRITAAGRQEADQMRNRRTA